mmetsp:Transcript_42274/g.134288  ORF Transcript_42274/g.134288 Transcript_42274/m.134288 type:complete len:292 (-) Transcript_42274:40-915(-)
MAWGLSATPTDLVIPFLVPPQVSDAAAAPFGDLVVAALRHAPFVVLLVLQLYAVGAGEEDTQESCSKALGFNESSGPRDRSNQDLQFCNEHHKRTCCERNHTRQVLSSWSAFSHDRSPRCAQMSRLALCSTCDGDVGTGAKARANSVLLCPSFCSRWFQSCYEDFFAPGGSSAGLQPCGPGSLVCSPLNEITEDHTTFCSGIGDFAVAEDEEGLDSCYDGVPAAKARGKAPRAHWVKPAPAGKPWWRRILSSSQQLQLHRMMTESLQSLAPGLVVSFVAVIFAWYVWRGSD